jgi:hypothetical protein
MTSLSNDAMVVSARSLIILMASIRMFSFRNKPLESLFLGHGLARKLPSKALSAEGGPMA